MPSAIARSIASLTPGPDMLEAALQDRTPATPLIDHGQDAKLAAIGSGS